MTFAQFKRMKPKYKMRLILVCALALTLSIVALMGISSGFAAIRRQLSTTTFSDITATNILQQSSMEKLSAAMKQDDPTKLLVIDSRLVCSTKGAPLELEMNLVSLLGTSGSDSWQITADAKKTVLRKTVSDNKNRASLLMRKLTFADYYPALSRVTSLELMQYLQTNFPVGTAGKYVFVDQFDNNLEPQFVSYLSRQLKGLWVSKIGALSEFTDTYVPISRCVPLLLSVEEQDTQKSKPKKAVLLPATEKSVVLMESGPYIK